MNENMSISAEPMSLKASPRCNTSPTNNVTSRVSGAIDRASSIASGERSNPNNRPSNPLRLRHVRNSPVPHPQASPDRTPFSVSYLVRHPWQPTGDPNAVCEDGQTYLRALPARLDEELSTLAGMTGISVDDLRKRMGKVVTLPARVEKKPEPREEPVEAEVVAVEEESSGLSLSTLLAIGLLGGIGALIGYGRWQRSG